MIKPYSIFLIHNPIRVCLTLGQGHISDLAFIIINRPHQTQSQREYLTHLLISLSLKSSSHMPPHLNKSMPILINNINRNNYLPSFSSWLSCWITCHGFLECESPTGELMEKSADIFDNSDDAGCYSVPHSYRDWKW